MKHEPEREARRWLLQAKHDLDDADFSLGGERFNLACFLSQQCVNIKKNALQFVINDCEFKETAIQWGYEQDKREVV